MQNLIPGRHFGHFFYSPTIKICFAFHYLYRVNKNTFWESPQGKSFCQIDKIKQSKNKLTRMFFLKRTSYQKNFAKKILTTEKKMTVFSHFLKLSKSFNKEPTVDMIILLTQVILLSINSSTINFCFLLGISFLYSGIFLKCHIFHCNQ